MPSMIGVPNFEKTLNLILTIAKKGMPFIHQYFDVFYSGFLQVSRFLETQKPRNPETTAYIVAI